MEDDDDYFYDLETGVKYTADGDLVPGFYVTVSDSIFTVIKKFIKLKYSKAH